MKKLYDLIATEVSLKISWKDFCINIDEITLIICEIEKWLNNQKVYKLVVLVVNTNSFFTFLMSLALNKCDCCIMYVDFSAGNKYINEIIDKCKPDYILWSKTEGFFVNTANKISSMSIWGYSVFGVHTSRGEYFNQRLCNEYPRSFVFFTSGTTAFAKAVIRNEKCIIEDAKNFIDTFNVLPSDRVLCIAPFSHVYGFGSGIIPYALTGGHIFFESPYCVGHSLIKQIVKNSIDVLIATPIHYNTLLAYPYQWDVKLWLSAGGKLDYTVAEEFYDKFGVPINNMYGSSETGGISTLREVETKDAIKSCGKPLVGVELRLVYKDEVSYIQVKSKSLSLGYINYDIMELEGLTMEDGWYMTNDVGILDCHHNLLVKGRENDMINIGGDKVSPWYIENAIRKVLPDSEILIRAELDKKHGEIPVVYINNKDIKILELAKLLEGNLDRKYVPKKIYYIDKIPYTSKGKIDVENLSNCKVLSQEV